MLLYVHCLLFFWIAYALFLIYVVQYISYINLSAMCVTILFTFKGIFW